MNYHVLFLLIFLCACSKIEYEVKDLNGKAKLESSSGLEFVTIMSDFTNSNTFDIQLRSIKAFGNLTSDQFIAQNVVIQNIVKIDDKTANISLSVINEGEVSLTLKDSVIESLDGTVGQLNAFEVIYDATAPEIILSQAVPAFTNSNEWNLEINLTEPIKVLTSQNFDLTNCVISNPIKINDLKYSVIVNPIAQGPIAINIIDGALRDRANNQSAVSVAVTTIFDTTAPNVLFSAPEAINSLNSTSYSISGVCEGSTDVTVTLSALPAITTSCDTNLWQLQNIDVSSLGEGVVSLSVTQVDEALNSSTTTTNTIKDTVSPFLTIDALAVPITVDTANYTFSGTCEESNRNVAVNVSGVTFNTTCLADQTWSITEDISVVVPDINLVVEHFDSANNPSVVNYYEFISVPQNFSSYTEIASNFINSVKVYSNDLYVATRSGLSISYDGGLTFSNKTSSNGLGSNYTNDVERSSDGKIFVATNNGLSVSTSGAKSFINKTTINGLVDNNVKTVAIDSNNILYVGTNSGLSVSNDFGETFTTVVAPNIVDNNINNIYVKGNTVYLCTQNGVSYTTDAAVSFSHFNSFSNNNVRDFYQTNNGTLYAATAFGLEVSNDSGSTFNNISGSGNSLVQGDVEPDNTLGSSDLTSLSYDETNNILYIGANGSLSITTDAAQTFSSKLSGSNLTSTAIKNNGELFIGSSPSFFVLGGLLFSNDQGASFSSILVNSGIHSNNISDVFVDTNGLYVSTNKGLAVAENIGTSFTTYGSLQGLTSTNVNKTYAHNGIIYIGTTNGLFIATDDGAGGKNFVKKSISNGLGNNNVKDVFVDTIDGNVYVIAATTNGISVSSDGGQNFTNNTTPFGIVGVEVLSVFAKKVGANVNIYATAHDLLRAKGGLAVSEDSGNSYTVLRTAEGLASGYARDVFVDSANKIYVATTNGVSVITDYGLPSESIQNSNTTSGLANNLAKSICVHNGVMYVATGEGLSISSNDGTSYITKSEINGLPTKSILSVSCKNDGTIYVGTGAGIGMSTLMLTLP